MDPPPGRGGPGRGGAGLRSPRPADRTAFPSLLAAPACRARPPPCLAPTSSRCRISTTCSRMAAAATASRASPATRSPPGSTWATRESPLQSPGSAGPSPGCTAHSGAGEGASAVAGCGEPGACSPLPGCSGDWAGAGRGLGGGRAGPGLESPPTPARRGRRGWSSPGPRAVLPFPGCTEPRRPLGQPHVHPEAATS